MPAEAPVGNIAFNGLDGTHWQLVELQLATGNQGAVRPDEADRYTITFHNDGSLSVRLDCNRGVGPWRNDISNSTGGTLAIGPLGVTKALCPAPSRGEALEGSLGQVRSFTVSGDRLTMALAEDRGTIVWKAAPYPQ
ncbi:MAG: META domain-containing protein [Erythrobacter sp.]